MINALILRRPNGGHPNFSPPFHPVADVVDHDRRNGLLALQISLGDAMGTIKQFGPTWS